MLLSALGFTQLDLIVLVVFLAIVVVVAMWQGRGEGENSADYFLAGRGLTWWLIGISLIAANMSTEQFVGMNGQAAGPVGLAIASYCWIASIGVVIVAFTFLPAFLKCGIYTIPEFLEYRYHPFARAAMAVCTVGVYVLVLTAAVVYSGAMVVSQFLDNTTVLGIPINLTTASWAIGIVAAVYVTFGGLKSCAWADLLQGGGLIVGGIIIAFLAFHALGAAAPADLVAANGRAAVDLAPDSSGVERFFALNADQLHMFLPLGTRELPWTALLLGLWIPNFYYWGLNQFIVQRTLAARSLAAGQRGVVMAGVIHIFTPLFVVVPGLIAFNMYSGDMAKAAAGDDKIAQANAETLAEYAKLKLATDDTAPRSQIRMDEAWRQANPALAIEIDAYNQQAAAAASHQLLPPATRYLTGFKYDTALGVICHRLLPVGIRGFVLAALLGAVISSLAAMLNSASSVFTIDLYQKWLVRGASQRHLVLVGRICVVLFAIIGCWLAPHLANPKFGGVFTFIQEFQGYISPGVLGAFAFGLAVRRAPPAAGIAALVLNPVYYGALSYFTPQIPFLDRIGLSFLAVLATMTLITLVRPLKAPIQLPTAEGIDLTPSRSARYVGIVVIATALSLYWYFR